MAKFTHQFLFFTWYYTAIYSRRIYIPVKFSKTKKWKEFIRSMWLSMNQNLLYMNIMNSKNVTELEVVGNVYFSSHADKRMKLVRRSFYVRLWGSGI